MDNFQENMHCIRSVFGIDLSSVSLEVKNDIVREVVIADHEALVELENLSDERVAQATAKRNSEAVEPVVADRDPRIRRHPEWKKKKVLPAVAVSWQNIDLVGLR